MKSNIFKYIFFAVVIILISFAIYFLYKDENNKSIALEEKKLEVNITDEINIGILGYDTINPILSGNRDIQYISKLIFKPLLDITKDFKIENNLASECSKINSETYLIKLKSDIYWHDKTKFTAKDVVFTINNLKQDNLDSIYKENVKEIKEVEQIDDYTIKIILNKEVPFFEYNMCFPILSYNLYEEGTLKNKTENIVGTGKYKVKKIEEDQIQIVSVDEKSASKIKRINIKLEKETKNLYNDFSKGELDYIITESVDFEKYIGTMGYNLIQVPNREFDYLILNNQNNILRTKEVRQAINLAIDKNSINYIVYNNRYNTCDFPLYYGSYLESTENINSYNINQAKNILIESGWKLKNNRWINKNKTLKFNFVVNKENHKRVLAAEEIKKQLENLGLSINLMIVNNYAYNNYLKNKNYDIILTGKLVSNSPNLETYFGENNLSNYKNDNMEAILKDIKNFEKEEVLKEKYNEINKIYNEQVPFISLYSNSLFILSNTKLKGDMSCNWYNLFYNIDNWYKVN